MKTKYSFTNKHLSRDEIIRLVKNQLHNDASTKAANHIQSCSFCNEAYQGIKQLPDLTVLQSLDVQWGKKIVRERKSKKLEVNLGSLYILLATVGLIALAIIFFFFFIK